ncbi:hypothetical protein DFR50_15912 [Roseiarcus fermentans]|uniref:Uncharacterized protein n=1 Tax=Roseiarcus fermentans TaxID=1473586 RepID=A0A366EF81_9HYPH|nr:hypothetical protein [Roseiarcus fermentans]RBP01067.1 hypothetical protein DFR50_15912 [Roseiarcus fermentans]
MSAKPRKSGKAARTRPAASADHPVDATPERRARAREAGAVLARGEGRSRRLLEPFDLMRANRVLAPHDPKLNDIRWLTGEALRRTHHRAQIVGPKSVDLAGGPGGAFGPRPGLPQSEAALHARDRLRAAETRVGPHAWPLVVRIVIAGGALRDCRALVPELATPWRADAVLTDRLRVALDQIGALMGVTR